MKNYLCLNGQKIELTKEQVTRIRDSVVPQSKLGDMHVGDIVKIGSYEFIVLEHSKETTALIMKDLLKKEVKFGDTADYKTSNVKKVLDKFAKELSEIIGEDNIIEHTVDLTSLDGLKHYGQTKASASLLTLDLYRRYVDVLDQHKLDEYYWLVTPWSVPAHGWDKTVLCVSPSGFIFSNGCFCGNSGVRPFCILKSNIFVS